MNNEFEGIWEEEVVAKFKALPRNLSGLTEENYEKPQSE
jgi:hypothetical protein